MKFTILEGQKYTCIGCGQCCQNWRITLTDEEEKKINAYPWDTESPRLAGKSPFAEKGATKAEAHRCLFLEADNKCLIHARQGYEAKPQTCRQFPVWVTQTPEENRVTVSFFCPAVANNQGDVLSQSPELTPERLAKLRPKVLKPKVALIGEEASDWSEFGGMEKELLGILDVQDLSVPQKLFGLYHRGYEFARAKMNRRDPKPLEESLAAARGQSGVPERFKAGLIRALFLSFMEEANRADYEHSRASFTWSFLMKIVRVAFGWGSIEIPALGMTVACADVDGVAVNWADEAQRELLTRYFRTLVFRRQMYSDQGLFRGGALMLVAFALIVWYARVYALRNKRQAVALEDVRSAIALVEKFFVQHNEGVQRLVSGGVFSLLFETLLANAVVASSLVHV